MALATDDVCPASLMIATRDLLGVEGRHDEVFAGIPAHDAALAMVATIFGAFEWGLKPPLRRQTPPPHGRPYLEYLASRGYRLRTVEHFLAGHLDFAGLRVALGTDGMKPD